MAAHDLAVSSRPNIGDRRRVRGTDTHSDGGLEVMEKPYSTFAGPGNSGKA